MRKLILFPILCITLTSFAQTKLIIQSPNEKVAELFSDDRNGNSDDVDGFRAQRFFDGAKFATIRSLLQFDLSSIPQGSFVNWARLSLFDPTSYGVTTILLRRVTSAWDPAKVTWNTQPTTTKRGTIKLSGSDQHAANFININVWKLVQPMIDSPVAGFGFEMKLDTENVNKEVMITFTSPVNKDPAHNPKLVLEYTMPGLLQETTSMSESIDREKTEMTIYPNPCNKSFNCNIKSSDPENMTLRVIDMLGRTVYSQSVNASGFQLHVNLPTNSAGTYFVVLQNSKNEMIVSQQVEVN